jgi:hypothetical protein
MAVNFFSQRTVSTVYSERWVRLHTPISAARTSAAAGRRAVRARASIARSTSRASLAMNTAKHEADANMAYPTPAESAAVLKRDLPDNEGGWQEANRKGKRVHVARKRNTHIRPSLKGAPRAVPSPTPHAADANDKPADSPGAKPAARTESKRSVSPHPNSQRPVSFAAVVHRNDKSAGLDAFPIHQRMSSGSLPLVATAPCLDLAKLFQAQRTTCTSLERAMWTPAGHRIPFAISALLLSFVSLIHGKSCALTACTR